MDKFDRAVRRHHVARLKNNRKTYWGYGTDYYVHTPMTAKQLGKVVQYPAICSCWMCGNPRRMMKGNACRTLTIQEQRHLDILTLGVTELSIS